MTEQQINKVLKKIHGGSYARVVLKTSIQTDKNHKDDEVIKVVRFTVGFGCSYKNLSSVKQKAAQKAALGLSESSRTLLWGTWKNRFLIENKGEVYVRLTCAKNNPRQAPKVLGYYVNGREVSKEEAKAITRPSEWKQKDSDVLSPKIKNVISIQEYYSEEEDDGGFLETSRLVKIVQENLPPVPSASASRRSKKRRAKKQGASCSC